MRLSGPGAATHNHWGVVVLGEREFRMEHRATHPDGLGVLDVGVAAGSAHHGSQCQSVRGQHLAERRRQQGAARRRGHHAQLGSERGDRPIWVPVADHQRVAEQPVTSRMPPGHHAGRVHPRHGGEDGVMPGEGDATAPPGGEWSACVQVRSATAGARRRRRSRHAAGEHGAPEPRRTGYPSLSRVNSQGEATPNSRLILRSSDVRAGASRSGANWGALDEPIATQNSTVDASAGARTCVRARED